MAIRKPILDFLQFGFKAHMARPEMIHIIFFVNIKFNQRGALQVSSTSD